MSKAIGYYRASTLHQKYTINVQREVVRDYCRENDIELIYEFEEIASGIEKKQLNLKKALDLSKMNNCPIICSTIDRLTRDYSFGKRICENYNTIFCYSPSMSIKTKLELLSFAEREKQIISERTRATLKSLKKKGVKLGNPNATFTDEMRANSIASRRKNAQLNENNIKASVKIKELLRETTNLSEIARILNDNGFVTSHGKSFVANQVKRLIKAHNL
jgi:DNA invertase Pin-like site-specific DNA recombinase